MTDNDFYEDDEPVPNVQAAFDAGEKGVTVPPGWEWVARTSGCRPYGDGWTVLHSSSQATWWGRPRCICPRMEGKPCPAHPGRPPYEPIDLTALERSERRRKADASELATTLAKANDLANYVRTLKERGDRLGKQRNDAQAAIEAARTIVTALRVYPDLGASLDLIDRALNGEIPKEKT